jgi:hypothetical protein
MLSAWELATGHNRQHRAREALLGQNGFMNSVADALQILGLEPGASEAEIREAYRDLCAIWHPDKHHGNERRRKKAEEMMKRINLAFEFLRDRGWQTKTKPGSHEATANPEGEDSAGSTSEHPYEPGPAPRCPYCDHVLFERRAHCPTCGHALLFAHLKMTAEHRAGQCYQCWLRSRHPSWLVWERDEKIDKTPEGSLRTVFSGWRCNRCGWSNLKQRFSEFVKSQKTLDREAAEKKKREADERRQPQQALLALLLYVSLLLLASEWVRFLYTTAQVAAFIALLLATVYCTFKLPFGLGAGGYTFLSMIANGFAYSAYRMGDPVTAIWAAATGIACLASAFAFPRWSGVVALLCNVPVFFGVAKLIDYIGS